MAEFERQVTAQERRKLRARHAPPRILSGFGYFGLIGWSVAVPTLLGAFLGKALDSRHSGGRSWTLTLLVAGLCVGCASAWWWLAGQSRAEDE